MMIEPGDDPVASATGQQQRAADGRASVWVAASAGTGKTKVLTDRVLNLMLRGSSPGRILCLTFTKAAAAEMANRINKRLSDWTTIGEGALAQEITALTGEHPGPDLLRHARRLFARVLDTPGGMKISTIHAFSQSLLRRFPLEAAIAPHFEVMDERGAAEILAEAREAVLIRARRGDDDELRRALAEVTRYLGEDSFSQLLGGLTLERARLQRLTRDGGHDAILDRLHRTLDVPVGATVASVVASACDESAFDAPALRAAASVLVQSSSITDQKRGQRLAAWLEDHAGRATGFADYAGAFLIKQGGIYKTLATKAIAGAHPAIHECLRVEAQRIEGVMAARGACALLHATAAVIRLAEALLNEYERLKALRAQLDYDDLILASCALLERPGVASWVLFKLDGGIDHILVDEAQDTNPEQWRIVAALAEEFFTGEGARSVDRTIFAVGDAKQSIYSFQRADPRAFAEMRAHFRGRAEAAGGRPRSLTGRGPWQDVALDISFRSTEAVLRAVDAVFAQSDARAGVAFDDTPIRHRAQRRGQAGLVELWPPVLPDPAGQPAPWEAPVEQQRLRAPAHRLADAIAAQIAHWLATREKLTARERPIKPGDIMVLVRRRGPFVPALVRALKQRGVPVAGVDRMVLTAQLVVEDLVALGQFLLLPEDDLTLAALLKSPLYGIDEETLFRVAHDRGDKHLWEALLQHARPAGALPALRRAASELSELLARADYVAPYELYAEVLSARGGRNGLLGRLGPEAADPLDEFLGLALAFERTHIPSLQGFLHWLATGEVEIKRDLDQQGRDEVRILTVHGAKGLQAPIVFLPDTLQAPNQSQRILWTEDGLPLWRPRAEFDAPAAQRARLAANARRDDEYRRLLYVAMTRAEDRLYVCGWQTRQPAPAGCWYNLIGGGLAPLAASLDFDNTGLIGSDGWKGAGFRLMGAQTETPRPDAAAAERPGPVGALPEWARMTAPAEPSPPRPLAPSRPEIEDPAARSPLDGITSGERAVGAFRRGLLVHRLLQILPQTIPEARPHAAASFLARPIHDLAEDEQRLLADETLAILSHPDFAALFGPSSQAEVPIVGVFGDQILSGQIDRLVVGEDSVLIVDYKTLRPPPRSEEQVPPAYLRQLAAYRAAVARIYPRHDISCALLWTDGPRLMPISGERLTRWAPREIVG